MFLLRSMFWLTVAFVVLVPRADIDTTVNSLSTQAVAAGQQLIVDQITATTNCETLQCKGGKAALSAILTSTPSAGSTMQEPNSAVPIPRPRPDWMG